jgi:hypothetical protein
MRLFTLSVVGSFFRILICSASAQVTPIYEFPDYISARACVQLAASNGIYDEGILGLGYVQQQSQTCLCGSIGSVSEQISEYIYTYASLICGDTIEASSAVAIFHEYCTASTGPPAAATSATPTSIALVSVLTTKGCILSFFPQHDFH